MLEKGDFLHFVCSKNPQRIRREWNDETGSTTPKLRRSFGDFFVGNYSCFKDVDVHNLNENITIRVNRTKLQDFGQKQIEVHLSKQAGVIHE